MAIETPGSARDPSAPAFKDSGGSTPLGGPINDAPMKIAYVSSVDPRDRRSWSGAHYYIIRALQKHCGEVSCIGPLTAPLLLRRILNAVDRRSQLHLRRKYDQTHSLLLSRSFAKSIASKIAGRHFDMIIAPVGSTEIAFLKTRTPIVYMSDTTFRLINDYYDAFSDLLPLSIWEGNRIESMAIRKARLLVYASQWAATSAVQDYGADPARTYVLPHGANVDAEHIPKKEEVASRRAAGGCNLLFLGVDWERKGGDITFEALLELERRGIDAHLTVCGCVPPDRYRHPRMHVIPFLDKNVKAQRERFVDLLWRSDLLFVPTRADCSPMVFSEASAYGLPIVSTATGGVPEIVHDGENGILLPRSARGAEYAERIAEVCRNQSHYVRLSRATRAAFESRLNWDAWALRLCELMTEIPQVLSSSSVT